MTDPNSACAGTSLTIGGQPYIDPSGLSPDQQFQAGLNCNGVKATPTTGTGYALAMAERSGPVQALQAGTW